MKRRLKPRHMHACMVAIICAAAALAAPAGATGTARIQQADGSAKTYENVRILIDSQSMTLVSGDGRGTLYIGKAACTKEGELIRCFPYDATYDHNGTRTHIVLQNGTVWLNPTTTKLLLPQSSMQIAPHGVVLSMHTKAGTYMSLTGTADEIKK